MAGRKQRGRQTAAADVPPEVAAARAKLAARGGTARVGGKGSMRRTHKAAQSKVSSDDKRLQNTLKRLNVQTIPAEEVDLVLEEGDKVLRFRQPKLQAAPQSNLFVVSGSHTEAAAEPADLGLTAEMIEQLKKMKAEGVEMPNLGADPSMKAGGDDEDDDDDLPELEGTFEDVTD